MCNTSYVNKLNLYGFGSQDNPPPLMCSIKHLYKKMTSLLAESTLKPALLFAKRIQQSNMQLSLFVLVPNDQLITAGIVELILLLDMNY